MRLSEKIKLYRKKNKMTKGYLYQYYNQLCVCIIRITETVEYLEHFSFKKTNVYGQAFDFYEFINCSSIIKECVDILFKIFDLDFKKYYKKKHLKQAILPMYPILIFSIL